MLKDALYRAITSPRGDKLLPVRLGKDLARRLNVTLGEPLCSREEADRRRAARAKLESLRGKATEVKATREAAPVMVYFEKNRNQRELGRIQELLDAKSIKYQLLDVAGDEATLAFVTREAGCEADDLPVVFVAGKSMGPFTELVRADVSGELARAVNG
jgi:glutaredoxin